MKKVQQNRKKITRNVKSKRKFRLLGYKIRTMLVYLGIFSLVSSICLFFSSAILFKIKEITVQGDTVCEQRILIEKSGIKIGDNLFFADTKAASAKLEGEISEVDKVEVIKKFPNKLIIDVKKAIKAYCIEVEGQYVLVSNKGKVLEISDERDENLIFLKELKLEFFEIGKKIVYAEKSDEKKLQEFIEKMGENGLSKLTEINFNDGYSFWAVYDNRIRINFGFYENIDYKIKTAAEVINNKLGTAEIGLLNLSEVSKENRSYFTPGY